VPAEDWAGLAHQATTCPISGPCLENEMETRRRALHRREARFSA